MAEASKCPFCGAEAEIYEGNFWVWVRCPDCNISTNPIEIKNGDKEEAKRKAVNIWNRRTKIE